MSFSGVSMEPMLFSAVHLVKVVSLVLFTLQYSMSALQTPENHRLVIPPVGQAAKANLTIFTVDRSPSVTRLIKSTHSNQAGKTGGVAPIVDAFQISPRARLDSPHLSATDGYYVTSDPCLGLDYRLSSLKPGLGQAFAVIANGHQSTKVIVSLDHHLPGTRVLSGNRTLGPGEHTVLKLQPNEVRVITSTSHSLDGVRVLGTSPIAVFSGSSGAALGSGSLENVLIENLPSVSSLGKEHVVVLVEGAASAEVKIVSAYADTDLTVTALNGDSEETKEFTLTWPGQHLTVAQEGSVLLLTTSKPVLVVQYISFGKGMAPAMTVIPGRQQWANSYHLYPLLDQSASMTHSASIVINTKLIDGLLGTNLNTLEDVTSLLEWHKIGRTGYSTASFDLVGEEPLFLTHFDSSVTLQVILSGRGAKSGAYALPGDIHTTCGEDATEDTIWSRKVVRKERPGERVLSRHRRSVVSTTPSSQSSSPDAKVIGGATAGAVAGVGAIIGIAFIVKNKMSSPVDTANPVTQNSKKMSPNGTSPNGTSMPKGTAPNGTAANGKTVLSSFHSAPASSTMIDVQTS